MYLHISTQYDYVAHVHQTWNSRKNKLWNKAAKTNGTFAMCLSALVVDYNSLFLDISVVNEQIYW